MCLKKDALRFIKEDAIPIWEEENEKRDSYIPRTLIPKKERDATRRSDQYPFPGFTEIEDEDLLNQSRSIVFGRAGAGKSYLVSKAYRDALNRFVDRDGEAPFPLFLDCSSHAVPVSNSIREALLIGPSGDLYTRIADGHSQGIHLFLDEADTRIRRDPNFATSLEGSLREIKTEVSKLRFLITLRDSEWDSFSILNREARRGNIKLIAFPDRPIGDEYSYLIPDPERRRSFFEKCQKRGFYDLLSLAFDGFELARKFNVSGNLPSTREKLWDQRIDGRLLKSDADIQIAQAPSRHRLRYLASLLACISYLSSKNTWSLRGAIDELSAPRIGQEQPVTPTEVNWLLRSRLFILDQGDRYRFIHNRYRDKLSAEILSKTKPRKQRLLLSAATIRGRKRVAPELRTVAATLASIEDHGAFREHIIENEPEIAIFGSLPRLSSERRKKLLSAVIQWGAEGHHPPWTEIRGIGERFNSALSRHRPPDPASFLEGYLTSDSEMERLWAATLASQWGGVPDLRDLLIEVVTNEEEKTGTRQEALEALEKAGNPADAAVGEELIEHPDDKVRGYALRAWRTLGDVCPEDYVSALTEDPNQPHLYGSLRSDPRRYAETLQKEEVEEAFHVLQRKVIQAQKNPSFNQVGPLPGLNSLHEALLSGLLGRVEENSDLEIPASLLVDFFVHPSRHSTARQEFLGALRANPDLWRSVLNDALERADQLSPYPEQLSNILAESIPGEPSEVLPADDELNTNQKQLIGPLRAQAEHNLRTGDGVGDGIASTPTVPSLGDQQRSLPSSLTQQEIERRIGDILYSVSTNTTRRATDLIKEFWRIQAQLTNSTSKIPAFRLATLKPSDLKEMIDLLDDYDRSHVISTLRDAFPSVAEEPTARPIAGYLTTQDVHLSSNGISDFLEASPFWTDDTRSKLEMRVLSYLRGQDPETWRETVLSLTNAGGAKCYRALQHLNNCDDSIYVSEAVSRLRNAIFEDRREWKAMVNYVIQQEAEDLSDTLVAALQQAESEDRIQTTAAGADNNDGSLPLWDVTNVLFEIIDRDDERGWEMLRQRVEEGALPLSEDLRLGDRTVPAPETEDELETLAVWYQKIRQSNGQTDHEPLASEVMERIIGSASLSAVKTVWDLQQNGDFEGAEWLSARCLEAEDAYLAETRDLYSPRRLLQFILTDYFHLIESDHDLYQVLLQVFNDLQAEFDKGQGVAGFWKPVSSDGNSNFTTVEEDGRTFTNQPRNEEQCQNILWALVRPRLEAYGLTDVEEDVIGPDYADLRIEHIQPGRSTHRVFVEVKVARRRYGPARLVRPLENQLWKKYLSRSDSKYGIYVVLWAKDPERHDWPAQYDFPADLKEPLIERATELNEKHGTVIEPVVLDVSTQYRS